MEEIDPQPREAFIKSMETSIKLSLNSLSPSWPKSKFSISSTLLMVSLSTSNKVSKEFRSLSKIVVVSVGILVKVETSIPNNLYKPVGLKAAPISPMVLWSENTV